MAGNTWIKRNQEKSINEQQDVEEMLVGQMITYLFVLILYTAAEFCGIFCENKRVTAAADLLQESLSWFWLQIMESL